MGQKGSGPRLFWRGGAKSGLGGGAHLGGHLRVQQWRWSRWRKSTRALTRSHALTLTRAHATFLPHSPALLHPCTPAPALVVPNRRFRSLSLAAAASRFPSRSQGCHTNSLLSSRFAGRAAGERGATGRFCSFASGLAWPSARFGEGVAAGLSQQLRVAASQRFHGVADCCGRHEIGAKEALASPRTKNEDEWDLSLPLEASG